MVPKRKGTPKTRVVRPGMKAGGKSLPALEKMIRYQYFPLRLQKQRLVIDEKFLSGLTGKTRVLEVGAGSGRLAGFLLKNSKLKPENYVLLDMMYDAPRPFMKRDIDRLHKKGEISLVRADANRLPFRKNSFEHILVPHAYFPKKFDKKYYDLLTAHMQKKLNHDSYWHKVNKYYARYFKQFINKMKPLVNRNGSIRISYIPSHFGDYIEAEAARLFPGFKLSHSAKKGGLILVRRPPKKQKQ